MRGADGLSGAGEAVLTFHAMTGPMLTDEELVCASRRELASGESSRSIDELFSRYHTRVAAWCLRITGDRESAADLAQEVFVKAWRNIDSFQGTARFSTWLYSIVRNHCFNHLRSSARRLEDASGDLPEEGLADSSEDALSALVREADRKKARDILDQRLDDLERKVFYLHFAEELPLDAVTKVLKLENASGAKAYIVSAKRKIQHALGRTAWS